MSQPFRYRLNGIKFSYYKSDQIRRLSVKEITSPVAFDTLNRPLNNGLYDSSMGVSPYDKLSRCITCGQENLECPDKLLKLLRAKCFHCHRIRVSREKIRTFEVLFLLIKLGYALEARELRELLETLKRVGAATKGSAIRKTSDTTQRKGSASTTVQESGEDAAHSHTEQNSTTINSELTNALLERKEKILSLLRQRVTHIEESNIINSTFEEFVKQFWASVVSNGKCPHCDKRSNVSIRKEGSSKFFITHTGGNRGGEAAAASAAAASRNKRKKSAEVAGGAASGGERAEGDERDDSRKKQQQYMNPMEVRDHVRKMWALNEKLMKLLYGNVELSRNSKKRGYRIVSNGWEMLFLEVIPVTPNRFRPENKLGDQTFLHGHTLMMTRILQLNMELRNLIVLQSVDAESEKGKQIIATLDQHGYAELKRAENVQRAIATNATLADVMTKWLELQDAVNSLLDATKASKAQERDGTGIRQILEKKEGLFRMKMMGKRVNYAARSVISADPNLETNEVGVPLFIAKKLDFPEPVNEHNVAKLRELVARGSNYPGANFIMDGGKKIQLEDLTEQQRMGHAKTLLQHAQQKVVYRHMMSGDVVLFNRQPSLHRSSLMSHIVRVLPREQTFRMHYANCKSYNADFDGDEMNLHYLQSHAARAEGYLLSLNDFNYINATNGKPLRELIQDHILAAMYLTLRGNFLEREQYQQLLYQATWNLFAPSAQQRSGSDYSGWSKIELLEPAILRPRPLWTGKQLISNVVKVVVSQARLPCGVNMESRSKLTSEELPGTMIEDVTVLIRDNEILLGVFDKNQLGSGAEFGFMHAFHELYGPQLLGRLFSCFSRLFSAYLQLHGFTCGMDDLILFPEFEEQRKQELRKGLLNGVRAAAHFVSPQKSEQLVPDNSAWDLEGRPSYTCDSSGRYHAHSLRREADVAYISASNPLMSCLSEKLLNAPEKMVKQLEGVYKEALNSSSSQTIQTSLAGLMKPFPANNFSAMTRSGAKGSKVNHSQVSALLGQQELEGRRVPVMPNGKTLPSFLPFDPNPRASGYICDRFLSGLRPQEFYFHCMAGREGLIDTAVKTSRSGYLQRCLIKHLESLSVAYDYTVRDADSSIVQFYFGEDSIDPCKNSYLEKYHFLAKNFESFSEKYDPASLSQHFDVKGVQELLRERKKQADSAKKSTTDTIMNCYSPGRHLGAVSERVQASMSRYAAETPLPKNVSRVKFRILQSIKYIHALIHPGEAVGCIAAQAVGEPSTQMTLNTFHLAGHGGVNLTLGIPRLREILMTATENIKTPYMELRFAPGCEPHSAPEAERYARLLRRLSLLELIAKIKVIERKLLRDEHTGKALAPQMRGVAIDIQLHFEDFAAIEYAFTLQEAQVRRRIEKVFVPNLLHYLERERKRDPQSQLKARSSGFKSEYDRGAAGDEDGDGDEIDKEFDPMSEASREVSASIIKLEEEGEAEQEDDDEEKKAAQAQALLAAKKGTIYDGQICTIKLKLPLDFKKLLIVNIVQKMLQNTIVREIKPIQNTVAIFNSKRGEQYYYLHTEGVSYKQIAALDFIDVNRINSNDIAAIYRTYGVEAARNSIIKEIIEVFKHYGVAVDYRHLSLIADYMTQSGTIKAMNRSWMEENVSPLLKMSFETCVRFLTNASTFCQRDSNNTPTSQIILGQPPRVGTGVCDILHDLSV